MSIGPPDDEERLTRLVADATSPAGDGFTPARLRLLKNLCRRSDALVELAWRATTPKLRDENSKVRLHAFRLVEELSLRSRAFRALVAEECSELVTLSAGLPGWPLPAPLEAADALATRSRALIARLAREYGESYPQFVLGAAHIRDSAVHAGFGGGLEGGRVEPETEAEASVPGGGASASREGAEDAPYVRVLGEWREGEGRDAEELAQQMEACFRALEADQDQRSGEGAQRAEGGSIQGGAGSSGGDIQGGAGSSGGDIQGGAGSSGGDIEGGAGSSGGDIEREAGASGAAPPPELDEWEDVEPPALAVPSLASAPASAAPAQSPQAESASDAVGETLYGLSRAIERRALPWIAEAQETLRAAEGSGDEPSGGAARPSPSRDASPLVRSTRRGLLLADLETLRRRLERALGRYRGLGLEWSALLARSRQREEDREREKIRTTEEEESKAVEERTGGGGGERAGAEADAEGSDEEARATGRSLPSNERKGSLAGASRSPSSKARAGRSQGAPVSSGSSAAPTLAAPSVSPPPATSRRRPIATIGPDGIVRFAKPAPDAPIHDPATAPVPMGVPSASHWSVHAAGAGAGARTSTQLRRGAQKGREPSAAASARPARPSPASAPRQGADSDSDYDEDLLLDLGIDPRDVAQASASGSGAPARAAPEAASGRRGARPHARAHSRSAPGSGPSASARLPASVRASLVSQAPVLPAGTHTAFWDSDLSKRARTSGTAEVYNHWGAVDVEREMPADRLEDAFLVPAHVLDVATKRGKGANEGGEGTQGGRAESGRDGKRPRIAPRSTAPTQPPPTADAPSRLLPLGALDSTGVVSRAKDREFNASLLAQANEALALALRGPSETTAEGGDGGSAGASAEGAGDRRGKRSAAKNKPSAQERLRKKLLGGRSAGGGGGGQERIEERMRDSAASRW